MSNLETYIGYTYTYLIYRYIKHYLMYIDLYYFTYSVPHIYRLCVYVIYIT